MPVPASINDLSTTVGSNSPSGSETPTEGDNYLRSLSAFIAQLRDKLNGTSDTGTVKNATLSGTQAGAATWSALQSFSAGISVSSTSGNVYSSTYTPTVTAVSNATAASATGLFKYTQVGTNVTVTGKLNINPTASGSTAIGISLPVASNFTATTDCIGGGNQGRFGETYVMLGLEGDITNDRAQFVFDAQNWGTARPFYVWFTYEVK